MSVLKRMLSAAPLPLEDAALLVVRLFVGLSMAFGHGLGKIGDLGKFTAKVADLGFPLASVLGPAAALSEFLGGILVALGLLTRAGAMAMLVTMLVAAFGVHADDPFKRKEFALLYASVALLVAARGPGRYSADARLFPRPDETA